MLPFGKQKEILNFLRQNRKSCRETAGTLFIERRRSLISNEKSVSIERSAIQPQLTVSHLSRGTPA
jgi:hypothetical protein